MQTKSLLFVVLALTLILNACSPFTITSVSGEQPTPIVEYDSPSAGNQAVTVDQVEVEVGVGSPIPVRVIVSANLPDPCSQVEHTEIKQDGSNFIITLSATPDVGGPAVDGCIKDALPFKMGIPLNVVGLPAGSYAVTVNGSRADFKLDSGSSTSSLPLRAADMPIVKVDLQVDDVNIEVGVGSPIPVHAVVSANLPNACAQLGEVQVHRDGTTFLVRLVAYVPAQTDCNPDTLPLRLEVPLNIVNLPEGPYEVNVNGVTASFDPRTQAAPTMPLPTTSEALIPAGWATHTASQQCGYAISHPSEMLAHAENPHSETLVFNLDNPEEGARNFIYISVITPEVKAGVYTNGDVYNYDPAESEILLNMRVGESKSTREFPNVESGFTYERKPDTLISGYAAQTYENVQPWEFPDGTKEIRYYLSLNGCTYLFGSYLDTTQSDQPGAITEELFNQIVATFQVAP